jgi:hypothetical protein
VITETTQPNRPPQPDLSGLDIRYDDNGRAHLESNGWFVSYAAVKQLGDLREFILDNTPGSMPAQAVAEHYTEVEEPEFSMEPTSLWTRAKSKFRRAAAELKLLPQTTLDLLGKGYEKAASRANANVSTRRGIMAYAASAALVGLAAGKTYANVVHGIDTGTGNISSPERHQLAAGLVYHPLGHTATHGTVSSPAHHELASQLQDTANTSSLSNPSRHQLASRLTYDPQQIHEGTTGHGPHGPGTHGHQHTGFVDREVFVEHGHGVTQELQDMHEQMGIHLTPEQHYAEYQYLVKIHGDNIFVGDPMYTMHNGDFGISHSGHVLWAPGVQANDHRWLKMHGFIK